MSGIRNKTYKPNNKSFWKRAKANQGELTPFIASIDQMCKKSACEQFGTQIKNRLRRELDADQTAYGSCILKNPEKPDDVFLTVVGLRVCHDILISYFDEGFLTEVTQYISNLDEAAFCKNEQQKILRGLSTHVIRQLVNEFEQSQTINGKPATQSLYETFVEELRARKIFHM